MGCARAGTELSAFSSGPTELKHWKRRSSDEVNAIEAHRTLSLAGSCSQTDALRQAQRSYQLTASHPWVRAPYNPGMLSGQILPSSIALVAHLHWAQAAALKEAQSRTEQLGYTFTCNKFCFLK